MEEKIFDFVRIWRFIRRYWIIIAALGISGAVIGYALARWVVHPTYQCTALIFAWSEVDQIPQSDASENRATPAEAETRDAQNDAEKPDRPRSSSLEQEIAMAKLRSYQLLTAQLTVGNLLMPDFQTLLNSNRVRKKISVALKEIFGTDSTPAYTLSARPLPKTRFVEIAVQSKSRNQTPVIIEKTVEIFTQEARSLLGINNTQSIDISASAIKVAPKIPLYTIVGLLLGLLVGGGGCFLIDFFDKSIRDLKELEERLQLPVLGVLPEVASMSGDHDGELWQQDTKSVYGEAIRSLRVNIEYLLPEKGSAKVFLTTSVNKSEGKSSVVSSMAIALAKIEKKVLLIDVDLRRPRQHRIFKLSNKVGLVDLLVSKKQFEEVVHRNVNLPGLDILTSGTVPITPSDLLGSRRLEEFLKTCANHYDYILLDAPPALGIADPMILGKLTDTTILICDCREANVDKLAGVTERLRQADVRLGGLVLNRFSLMNKSDYYYYYQHYYYGYHYSYTAEPGSSDEFAIIPDEPEGGNEPSQS